MIRYARFCLSSLALVLGFLVLAISFSTANTALSASSPYEASQKQFYMEGSILPDHVAYPVLMAMDRVRLELDTPSERIYTQVEYSQRRFVSAEALLEKGNHSLAMTTLTKSQKYLIQAAHELRQIKASPTATSYVIRALNYYRQEMEAFKPHVGDADRAAIDHLIFQNQTIANELTAQASPSASLQ